MFLFSLKNISDSLPDNPLRQNKRKRDEHAVSPGGRPERPWKRKTGKGLGAMKSSEAKHSDNGELKPKLKRGSNARGFKRGPSGGDGHKNSKHAEGTIRKLAPSKFSKQKQGGTKGKKMRS